MAFKLLDDLGRTLVLVQPPRRIVSLVPSDTYTLVALGVEDRIVGRTAYCEHALAAPAVGGTKNVDVDAVAALAPQLVIANQEENTRAALEALAGRGVPVFVSLPRRYEHGVTHVARLARMLGVEDGARDLVRRGYAQRSAEPWGRAFIPIWMDPLMTMNADTYGSDVLAHAGIENVFGDRLRLYPLAADLGKSAPQDAAGRDVRYPRVTLDEVASRRPEMIILPDEPHAFTPEDERVFREALPDAPIVHVRGKDLFWYGAWAIETAGELQLKLQSSRSIVAE